MLKKLSLFLLVAILVGGVVDTWAGLTTLARRKSYSSGEVFTASDYNNDLDHFINAYNLIVPYFQGDSLKVVIVASDTLVSKAIAKIVVKDPLVSLTANDSLLFHLANIRRINADSLYIGTPLAGFSVGFTAGKRVFIGYGRADTMSVDSLSVIAGKINFAGSTITNLGTVTTADINGGTIDGTAVGAASPSTGAFTTLSATGNTSLTGTSLTVSATPVFSGGLTTNQLNVTGTSQLTGRATASAGITSTISSTFSGGITTTSLSSDATTETTSGTTGAIHTDGGLGVLKDIYLGDDLLIAMGAVFNWDAGDVTWTHSAAKLTLGGDGAVELDFNNHEMTNVDVNSGAIDGTTIGAASASSVAATTLSATGDVTLTGNTLTSSTVANFSVGLTTASLTATTADINGGTIDNATVGAGTPSSGAFTTLSANGNTSLTGTSLTVSATPVFSGGLTTNQLRVTGTSALVGRVTASAGLTSTISSTFSAGMTTTGISDDATTETTSGTTGAIHTDGGLGVLKDVYVGDDLFIGSSGSVLNWNTGDITWTHSAGKLTFGGDGAVELDYANIEQTNVDINSGAVDGTTLGAASPSSAAVTTLNVSGAAVIGDGGDAVTVNASKTTVKGPFVIGRNDTTVATSVKRFEPFDLHNPDQLGKFVVGGDGKMKLVSMYDEYRQIEKNTSLVRTDGIRAPDYGVGIITTAGDSVVVVNGATQAKSIVWKKAASNMLGNVAANDLRYLDGDWWVAQAGTLTRLEMLRDGATQYSTSGVAQYKGYITNRNAASGYVTMSSSPAIVNNTVNAVSAIRSPWPFHRDAFGRQLPYWGVATANEEAVTSYNATGDLSIFDTSTGGDPFLTVKLLEDGGLITIANPAARGYLYWSQKVYAATGDAWGISSGGRWDNGQTGSEKLRWGDATVFSDVAAILGASGAGNNSPLIWLGADAGLVQLHAKANDNTNGAKAYKDATINTSLIYGNVMAAWSPASTASIGGIAEIFSTGETAVTRAATVAGPTSHSWSYNGTTSVTRVADHDSLTFLIGQSMSIAFWVNFGGSTTGEHPFICKLGMSTGSEQREYEIILASGTLYFSLYDETNNTSMWRSWNGTFPASGDHLLVFTWDGATTQKIYLDGVQIDNGGGDSGFSLMVNGTAPVLLGAQTTTGGAYYRFGTFSMTPPQIVRGVIPQFVIEAEYRRGKEAIQSPTSDLLPTLAVKTVEADPSGQHVLVTTASEVTLMSQTGAVQDTFKCTGCGTLNHAVFGPNSVGDSLEIYIGGSLKYRRIGNEVSVEALAAREYQDRSVMFGSVLEADSAGYGGFWRVQDMLDAASVVNARAGHVKAGTYPNPITSVPAGFSLWGDGVKTLVTNASSTGDEAMTVTGDTVTVRNMAFRTAPGGAGGGQDAILWSGANGVADNLTVIDADDDGWVVSGRLFRGSNLHTVDADDDAWTSTAGRSILMAPVFSSGGSSIVWSAAADSSRVIGGQMNGNIFNANGAVKNAVIGTDYGALEDIGSGVTEAGNP